MNPLLLRVLSALVALPLALGMVHLGGVWFFALVFFAGAIALFEWNGMTAPGDRPLQILLTLVGLGLTGLVMSGRLGSDLGVGLLFGLVTAVLLLFLFRPGPMETSAQRLALSLTGLFWVGGLLGVTASLRFLPEGVAWLYVAFSISFGSDTGGYFAGRFLGRHKLYEKVSPKKTWEGSVGGVFAALIFVGLFHTFIGPKNVPLSAMVLPAILGSALGQCGDLAESLVKRSVGVKDSGSIMPGHGGLLDRIDALLFVGVFLYLYALLGLGLAPTWP